MWTDDKGRIRTDQADLEDTRKRMARVKWTGMVRLPKARVEAMLNDALAEENKVLDPQPCKRCREREMLLRDAVQKDESSVALRCACCDKQAILFSSGRGNYVCREHAFPEELKEASPEQTKGGAEGKE